MGKKFDEFYYKPNNQIISVDVFWQEFDENCQAARDKYGNNIYCPLCRKAKLTWADGAKRRYFRSYTDHIDCDYQYEELNKIEVKEVKENLSDSDIASKLQTCINRVFRREDKTCFVNIETGESRKRKDNNTMLTIKMRNSIKHIPTRSWDNILFEDDEDVDKIYFGKCKCYWGKPYNEKNNIYIYSYRTNRYIGKIIITDKVKKYLPKEMNMISQDKADKSSVIMSLWAAPFRCDVGCKFYLKRSTYVNVKLIK